MAIEITSRGDVSDFVRRMPKAELHLHLDGTLEPGMKIMLARRNGVEISPDTEAEIRASFTAHNDLPSFLAVFYSNMDVLRTAQDFEDLAFQYLSTAAANNIRHAEMFFDPQLHTRRGIRFEEIISGYRRAITRAGREFGITAELIMCFLRDFGADYAMATLTQALAFKAWIIGIGLDSDEKGHPPAEFAHVFARARQEGFLITTHCDVDQQDSPEHIRQAICDIEVDRIDHGLNILETPELVATALDRRLGFTVCPLPYSTHVVGIEPELKRIAAMLDAGLLVSIGADDPPFFGGYLNDNIQACLDHGFTPEIVLTMQRNAFLTAWIPERRRRELLDELDTYVADWSPR